MIPTAIPTQGPVFKPDPDEEAIEALVVAVGAGVDEALLAGCPEAVVPAITAKTVKWLMVKVAVPPLTVPSTNSHALVASL